MELSALYRTVVYVASRSILPYSLGPRVMDRLCNIFSGLKSCGHLGPQILGHLFLRKLDSVHYIVNASIFHPEMLTPSSFLRHSPPEGPSTGDHVRRVAGVCTEQHTWRVEIQAPPYVLRLLYLPVLSSAAGCTPGSLGHSSMSSAACRLAGIEDTQASQILIPRIPISLPDVAFLITGAVQL